MKRQGCRRKKTPQKTSSQEQKNSQNNGDTLRSAVMWIVNGLNFDHLKLHGNTKWLPCHLIILAVLWVWSGEPQLTEAFKQAHKLSMTMLGSAAVNSFQGMMGALVTATGALLPVLWARMHELMERHGGEHFRIDGWLPLAVDGSRIGVPSGSAANGSQRGCVLREKLWSQRQRQAPR